MSAGWTLEPFDKLEFVLITSQGCEARRRRQSGILVEPRSPVALRMNGILNWSTRIEREKKGKAQLSLQIFCLFAQMIEKAYEPYPEPFVDYVPT
jgi:hypothetical protein